MIIKLTVSYTEVILVSFHPFVHLTLDQSSRSSFQYSFQSQLFGTEALQSCQHFLKGRSFGENYTLEN